MQFITTISQKGQVVVPKDIRDKLKLKASDTLKVRLSDNNIIMEPNPSIDQFVGMFTVKKPITQKDIKDASIKHTEEKFK